MQSSSSPLQFASLIAGSMLPTHVPHVPLVHVCVPYSHTPTSVVPHCLVCPLVHEHPLSMTPSQSSSAKPLQTSVVGVPGVHVLPPQLPAVHVSVPAAAHAPTPQLVGLVKVSSVLPSQSLSMLSHVSVVGVPGVHVFPPHVPALHVSVPVLAHAPVPQLVALVRVSSVVPSQSSSMLLHVSVVAPPSGLHVFPPHVPAVHVSVPVLPEHAPTPQVVPLVKLSSVVPSQSSSRLLHVSVVAVISPMHAPHAPAVHV